MATVVDRPAGTGTDFIALICADEDLLRAEFEEIVSAGWGPPPLPAGDRGGYRDPDVAGHSAELCDRRPCYTAPGVGCDERARQRSPPDAGQQIHGNN
jgi:hypothetical protein